MLIRSSLPTLLVIRTVECWDDQSWIAVINDHELFLLIDFWFAQLGAHHSLLSVTVFFESTAIIFTHKCNLAATKYLPTIVACSVLRSSRHRRRRAFSTLSSNKLKNALIPLPPAALILLFLLTSSYVREPPRRREMQYFCWIKIRRQDKSRWLQRKKKQIFNNQQRQTTTPAMPTKTMRLRREGVSRCTGHHRADCCS